MSRKILLLNMALVALAGVLVWQLRMRWKNTADRQQKVLTATARAPKLLPPPPLDPPKPAAPGDYVDVAQKTLFARDRNPTPIIEPPPAPPAPPPEKPLPPMPFYHGQMALTATPVAVLSMRGNDQKGYHVGEEVGPFKLVAFDRESITLEWDGKTLERKLAELKPKEAAQPASAAAAAPPASSTPSVKPISGGSSTSNPANAPKLGNDMGNGFRGCLSGDDSPAGTVFEGYRKVLARTAMGTSCHWEQSK